MIRTLLLVALTAAAGCVDWEPTPEETPTPPIIGLTTLDVVGNTYGGPVAGADVFSTFDGRVIDSGSTSPDGSVTLNVADGGELTAQVGNTATTLAAIAPFEAYRINWWWNNVAVPPGDSVQVEITPPEGIVSAGSGCGDADGDSGGAILVRPRCRYADGAFSIWGIAPGNQYGAVLDLPASTTDVALTLEQTTSQSLVVHGTLPYDPEHTSCDTQSGPTHRGILIAPASVVSQSMPGAVSHSHSLFVTNADSLFVGIQRQGERDLRGFVRIALTTNFDLDTMWPMFPDLTNASLSTAGVPTFRWQFTGTADASLVYLEHGEFAWVGIVPADATEFRVPPIPELTGDLSEWAVGRYRVEPPLDTHADLWKLWDANAGYRTSRGSHDLPY